MLWEESRQLAGRIGACGVGVGAAVATPRPGVAGAVDGPPLHDGLPAAVAVDLASVGVPAVYLTPLHRHGRDGRSRSLGPGGGPLLDQAIGIARMDSRVAIPMEEDQL